MRNDHPNICQQRTCFEKAPDGSIQAKSLVQQIKKLTSNSSNVLRVFGTVVAAVGKQPHTAHSRIYLARFRAKPAALQRVDE